MADISTSKVIICDASCYTTTAVDNKQSRRFINCSYPSCTLKFHSKCIKYNKKTDEDLRSLQFTCDKCDVFLNFTVKATLDNIFKNKIIEQSVENALENSKNVAKLIENEVIKKCEAIMQNCRYLVEENTDLQKKITIDQELISQISVKIDTENRNLKTKMLNLEKRLTVLENKKTELQMEPKIIQQIQDIVQENVTKKVENEQNTWSQVVSKNIMKAKKKYKSRGYSNK